MTSGDSRNEGNGGFGVATLKSSAGRYNGVVHGGGQVGRWDAPSMSEISLASHKSALEKIYVGIS
jgi:hypothetical protein